MCAWMHEMNSAIYNFIDIYILLGVNRKLEMKKRRNINLLLKKICQ